MVAPEEALLRASAYLKMCELGSRINYYLAEGNSIAEAVGYAVKGVKIDALAYWVNGENIA